MSAESFEARVRQALYAGLVELREDLMQHIHLENNVLFPRAEQDPCQGWQRCC